MSSSYNTISDPPYDIVTCNKFKVLLYGPVDYYTFFPHKATPGSSKQPHSEKPGYGGQMATARPGPSQAMEELMIDLMQQVERLSTENEQLKNQLRCPSEPRYAYKLQCSYPVCVHVRMQDHATMLAIGIDKTFIYMRFYLSLIELLCHICRSEDVSLRKRRSPSPDPFIELLGQYLKRAQHKGNIAITGAVWSKILKQSLTYKSCRHLYSNSQHSVTIAQLRQRVNCSHDSTTL